MRLIPSISPEASVSGQGKQGMTPSGAHQCCSASSSVQAGGGGWFEAAAHPPSAISKERLWKLPSLGSVAVVTPQVLQGTGNRSWGSIRSSCHHLCKGSSEAGVVLQVTPPKDYPRMLSQHVPSQRCPRKGMFEPRLD